MSVHLIRQIEKLKKVILNLGAKVEQSVRLSIESIGERDDDLALRVINDDTMIDEMEIDIEEECLQTLALHQPVAHDLRYVIAVLKINNDLERIADLAVNIAEQSVALSNLPALDRLPFDMTGMTFRVQTMLKQCLDSLVNQDIKLAQEVRQMDDEVDDIHREMYDKVQQMVKANPENLDQLMRFVAVSRCLERIADHAENIAEDVMYMAKGTIYRHEHGLENGNNASELSMPGE